MMAEDYDFPNCMHVLSAAMHRHNINPESVEITLPKDEWWRLWSALEAKFSGIMMLDGRVLQPCEFRYMGFTFKVAK